MSHSGMCVGGAVWGCCHLPQLGSPVGLHPSNTCHLRPSWGQVFKGQTWVSDLPEAGAASGALRAGLQVAGLEGQGEGKSGQGRGEGRPGSRRKQGRPRPAWLCPVSSTGSQDLMSLYFAQFLFFKHTHVSKSIFLQFMRYNPVPERNKSF